MPGMGTGICVHSLMMALHWVLPKIRNVKLIPFRKAGQFYQEPARSTHSREAMNAAYAFLVKKDQSVIRLFDPPFNLAVPNPGLYPGISARSTGKWRTVYPCCDMADHGHSCAWRQNKNL